MFTNEKLADLIVDKLSASWYENNPEQLPVWVIGDVHGCAEEYKKLLERITKETPSCFIYQLGDLIDRGPYLYEVFDLNKQFNVRCTLGNHELNFYQEALGIKPCRSKYRLVTHGMFEILSKKKQEFILESIGVMPVRSFILSNDVRWALSHSLPKHQVKTFDCTNGSNMSMTSDPYSIETVRKIHSRYVHGHMHWDYFDIHDQILNNLVIKNHIYNLDSGCCYGGKLTAIELSSLQVLQEDGFAYASKND